MAGMPKPASPVSAEHALARMKEYQIRRSPHWELVKKIGSERNAQSLKELQKSKRLQAEKKKRLEEEIRLQKEAIRMLKEQQERDRDQLSLLL
jgi:hypothetical protein